MTDRGTLPSVYVRMPRMSALKLVLWGLLVILDAVALAFVTGLVNPQEKVNRLWLVVGAAAGLSRAMKSWMSCSHCSACSAQVSSAMSCLDATAEFLMTNGPAASESASPFSTIRTNANSRRISSCELSSGRPMRMLLIRSLFEGMVTRPCQYSIPTSSLSYRIV